MRSQIDHLTEQRLTSEHQLQEARALVDKQAASLLQWQQDCTRLLAEV